MQNDANLKPQRHFNHHFGYLIMLNFWGRNGSTKINHLKSCVVVPLFPCLSCKNLRFDEHICHNGGRNPQHSFGHWVPKRNCKHHLQKQIISRLRIRKLLMLSGCTKGQSAIMLRKLFRTSATCLRRTTIFEPQNNNELEKPGFHFWIPVVLFSFFCFPHF